MLEEFFKYLGAGDKALTVMGPIVTIGLAWLFGGALTQFCKFPLAKIINDGWFDWSVRAFAVAATAVFARELSNSLHWTMQLGVGIAQPLAYHSGLGVIRHYWPWMEASPLIGGVVPSETATVAAQTRAQAKAPPK